MSPPRLSEDEANALWEEAVDLRRSRKEKDNRRAIKLARRLIEEGPNTPYSLSKLKCLIADTYSHNLGQHDEAIAYYQEALEDDASNSLAGSNLGFAYLTYKEDYESAIEILQQTLDRGVSSVFIRESTKDWLADAKRMLGREEAAQELAKPGDSAVEPLIGALEDDEWHVRSGAAEALGGLGEARAVEPLIAALEDDEKWVRKEAAGALAKLGDARAVEPLIAALEDHEWDVRTSAARALGELGDARAVEGLIAALEDDNWGVRSLAARALGELDDARGVKPLIVALEDNNAGVRKAATEALEALGWQPGKNEAGA